MRLVTLPIAETNKQTNVQFGETLLNSNGTETEQIESLRKLSKPTHALHTPTYTNEQSAPQQKKESVLWQDKLKSLIQDPAHRGDHVTETWAALLETKESRIAVMERDISLLEKELLQQQQLMQQQRDHWVRSIEQSNPTTPVPPRTATPSQQAAAAAVAAAAQLYRHSPVNNGQTAQHKDAVSCWRVSKWKPIGLFLGSSSNTVV
jgi:TolA-binding protein